MIFKSDNHTIYQISNIKTGFSKILFAHDYTDDDFEKIYDFYMKSETYNICEWGSKDNTCTE